LKDNNNNIYKQGNALESENKGLVVIIKSNMVS